MICFDGNGEEYWQKPEIRRLGFSWRDQPLTDAHKIESTKHYDEALLIDISCKTLQGSATMRAAFLKYKELSGVSITAERMDDAGDYCTDRKHIRINVAQPLFGKIVTLAHEYRHAIQDIENLNNPIKKRSRRCRVLLSEADAVAFEITVAYELRETFPKLWDELCEFSLSYNILCDVFERAIKREPDALQSGLAAHMVLENYMALSNVRDRDFEHYFGSAHGFRNKISPTRAFNALNQYYEASIGMPYCKPNAATVGDLAERCTYLNQNPENTDRITQRLRGFVLY